VSTSKQKLLAGQIGSAAALADFERGTASDAADRARKGRPKGARNRARDQVDAEASACRQCGSTRRTPYFNKRELPIRGIHLVTRKPYTKIVIRRTKCQDCGQHRDDRHFLNEPDRRGRRRIRSAGAGKK